MNLNELRIILDNRPLGTVSTWALIVLKILSWILALLCFSVAMSFLLEASLGIQSLLDLLLSRPTIPDELEQVSSNLAYFLSFIFFLLFLVLAVSTYFYSMVIRRNRFIDHIESWCNTFLDRETFN